MTNEEAIKVITTLLYNQTGVMGNNQREGVFMAVDALGKQIPKKPIEEQNLMTCPVCGCQEIESIDASGIRQYPYCPCCGQAIDWSEDND